MDAIVAVLVLYEWIHLLFHKDPDDLVVAVVASPVHWRRAAYLGCILHRLEVVLFFIFFSFVIVGSFLLLFVLKMRLMLD